MGRKFTCCLITVKGVCSVACTSFARKWTSTVWTLISSDQSEDDSCCWELSSSEPPSFCGLEMAMLCLVAVSKVLLTLKEGGGSYPDMTSPGKLNHRGENVSQTGIPHSIWLPVNIQNFLIFKLFLTSWFIYSSSFLVEVCILSEFKSKMAFFLISHILASDCRVVCKLAGL